MIQYKVEEVIYDNEEDALDAILKKYPDIKEHQLLNYLDMHMQILDDEEEE